MSLDFESLPLAEDGSYARMPKEEPKQANDYLPQFDDELWFLSVLGEREQAAVAMAYKYAEMGQPGLPDHLYLKVIYTMSELLRQIDVEVETDGQD